MNLLIKSLEELFEIIKSRTGRIKFNKKHPQQLCAVCLYGTIFEISLACLTLLKDERTHAAIPILLRNLMEAYIDLINLVKCPEYVLVMNANYLEQKRRLFNAAINDGHENPFFEPFAEYEKLDDDYNEIKEDLKDWKEHGIEPIDVKQRFRRAGMKNQYAPIYMLLCSHSHNNIDALEKRHIKKSNGDYQVHCFKRWEEKELLPFLSHISIILFDSLKLIGKLLEISDRLDISEIEVALKKTKRAGLADGGRATGTS